MLVREEIMEIQIKVSKMLLSKYATADYFINYKLFNSYNLTLSAKNLFDKKYSEAYEYKAPGRSLGFMLNKNY